MTAARPSRPPPREGDEPARGARAAAKAAPGGSILWPILAVPPTALVVYVVGLARGMQTAPSDNDFFVGAATGAALIGVVLLGLVALFARRLRLASALACALALVAILVINALYP